MHTHYGFYYEIIGTSTAPGCVFFYCFCESRPRGRPAALQLPRREQAATARVLRRTAGDSLLRLQIRRQKERRLFELRL